MSVQVFGRRQTFWDTALQLITSQSQDSNLLTAFVRLICTAAVNFTAGMLCSIFLFAFQLPSMVMSYQVPNDPPSISQWHSLVCRPCRAVPRVQIWAAE